MLNISDNSIQHQIDAGRYRSFDEHLKPKAIRRLARFLLILMGSMILLSFLPWTQNIRARGYITALSPDKRPQSVQSVIDGRIEKWYVQEGEYVQRGDTILQISEIKSEYFDPLLLERTESQIQAKTEALAAYRAKAQALSDQINALERNRKLKVAQTKNYLRQAMLKVASDSIALQAARLEFSIADSQLTRMENLYKDGLKSLTDLEARRQKQQEKYAKLVSAENKLLTSRNEMLNARMELNTVDNEYRNKIAKAISERSATLANVYDTEAAITKMKNELSNYTVRSGYYFITAPQDGYITQAITTGVGETVKEGEPIITIMPDHYQMAVEMYVDPMDYPLIHEGQEVQIQFDGWPAIVFSGWPNSSFGTYTGRVVAKDNFISTTGKYRLLVAPDTSAPPWPEGIRVGGGASTMALLKDVPIWYEVWRQLNGFPPDFYQAAPNLKQPMTTKKAP